MPLKEVGFDAKAFEADISPVLDCTTTGPLPDMLY